MAKREVISVHGKGLLLDIHCGGSWKYDVYFGTGPKNKAIAPLHARAGGGAFHGATGLPQLLAGLGYEIPGHNGIPEQVGPTGNLIHELTWADESNALDGVEIEIHRKRHLHKPEKIEKLANDFATALLKFLHSYYEN